MSNVRPFIGYQCQNVKDSKERDISQAIQELWIAPTTSTSTPNQQNELSFMKALSTTETASSTLQTSESNATHDSVEPTTNVCLPYGLEKENDLETHVIETINTLLSQLQSDLPKNKDLITQSASKQSSSHFQVCSFIHLNDFPINDVLFSVRRRMIPLVSKSHPAVALTL